MDPRRALVERNAHFTRGPRFFREGEVVLFEFVIDATNVMGPRPATSADMEGHADAWCAFWHTDEISKRRSMAGILNMHARMAEEGRSFDGPVPPDPERAAKLRAEAEGVVKRTASPEHTQGPPAKRAYRRKARPEETV